MKPKKISAIRSLSFQSASAAATSRDDDQGAEGDAFGVSAMTRGFSPLPKAANAWSPSGWEQVLPDERRHAMVLALPFAAQALGLAAVGIGLMAIGWPASIAGVALQVVGAGRGREGGLDLGADACRPDDGQDSSSSTGRCASAQPPVRLARIGAVEIEQGLVGRVLGYGDDRGRRSGDRVRAEATRRLRPRRAHEAQGLTPQGA
jgi:hypothetical protein